MPPRALKPITVLGDAHSKKGRATRRTGARRCPGACAAPAWRARSCSAAARSHNTCRADAPHVSHAQDDPAPPARRAAGLIGGGRAGGAAGGAPEYALAFFLEPAPLVNPHQVELRAEQLLELREPRLRSVLAMRSVVRTNRELRSVGCTKSSENWPQRYPARPWGLCGGVGWRAH